MSRVKFILFFLCYFFFIEAHSQITDTFKIPLQRQFFHDNINKEQKKIELLDGIDDNFYKIGNDDEANQFITDVLFRKIDDWQLSIERNDSISKNNEKIRLLTYISKTLQGYRNALIKKEISANELNVILESVNSVFQQNYPFNIRSIVNSRPYPIAKLLADVFSDQPDAADVSKLLYFKYSIDNPKKILSTIKPYINDFFADSLIVIAAKNDPSLVFTYALSVSSPEAKLIHRSKNPVVKNIVYLTQLPQSLSYFPFLDNIINKRIKVDDIKILLGTDENSYDSVGYYKLLVKTAKEYAYRINVLKQDTPICMYGTNGLIETLKERALRHFVSSINTLHDESDLSKRMRAIHPLTADEIYYMIVMGENDIYTSSFNHSFNRLLQKLGPRPRTDSLLQSVHFDYYKKFIKMSANFNKLDTLLKLMPTKNAENLMKSFVSDLENTTNLEDAVDVADCFSSISDKKLLKSMIENIKLNEAKCNYEGNERGAIIYGILKNIFLSSDSANHVDLKSVLNIPSVFEVNKKELQDANGRIVQQVFFYGDNDGKGCFNQFLNSFSDKEWITIKSKEWVEIRSKKSNVFVFANLPLDYNLNLDDSAQAHLNNYLKMNGYSPSIVIHRGHSYWLPGTIERMPGNVKIVILGSCGGYKNLNKILEYSPKAHIISTKEIGTGDINRPIINHLNQSLLYENKIVWKQMWKKLTLFFKKDYGKSILESWESYIPPYRNLGAIFIRSYDIAMKNKLEEEANNAEESSGWPEKGN